MTPDERARALERCEQELERIKNTHDEPALLLTLAAEDWEAEKRAIEAEARDCVAALARRTAVHLRGYEENPAQARPRQVLS